MTVQISWLLSQKQLSLSRRGARTAHPAPVTFVHATELTDPSPWLSGGELILTTGLGLSDDADELRSYIDRLHGVGVSCLGFGIGLSHSVVPDALVERADEVGLEVLEVPFEIPFAAIVRTVMNKIAEQEYEEVLQAAKVQNRITRAALHGGVDAIVKELATSTATTVAYVGRRTSALYPRSEQSFLDEVRQLVAARGRSGTAASISVSEPGRSVTVQPVGLSAASSGHVAMMSTGPISSVNRILLGHAVSLVTLELEQPARSRVERSTLHSLALASMFDSRFDQHPVPTVLNDAAGADGLVRALVLRSAATQDTIRHLDGLLFRAGRGLYAHVDGDVVTVLLRGDDASSWVDAQLPDDPTLRAGLSTAHSLPDIRKAATQARMALGMAGSQRAERLVEFGNTRASVVLRSAPAREAFLTLASSTVDVLAAHDREHGVELLASLRSYLAAHGHWEGAAANLGVHRHTLRGRIARVQEVLDVDLTDARVRAELLLAILVSDGR